MKPDKISFNNISVKNQQIKTNTIEQNCYNLNVKYFDNLIEINIKNIPNKFIRFKRYENILHFLNCMN